MNKTGQPTVALVHDHLTQDGGAERVLRVLSSLYPEAPIYTLAYRPERFNPVLKSRVHTSFLDRFPFTAWKFEWLLPFMPTATEHYSLRPYDLVISSASSMAKGVLTRTDALHICYCHTPTRYLWTEMHEYVERLRIPGLAKRILPIYLSRLRQWDRAAADRVDVFVANSKTVRDRIWKFYRRDAEVIYPPVDTHLFLISDEPKTYFLAGGRIMAYKKFDLIVDAFNRLQLPLKIFGSGPMLESLKTRARPNIEFVGRVSDEEKARLYAECIAFIHPQEEDFGIVAVEAMAAGRPVIAFGKGGATETVIENETGALFHEQTWEGLVDALVRFDEQRFSPVAIKAFAEQFSRAAFETKWRAFVEEAYANRHRHSEHL